MNYIFFKKKMIFIYIHIFLSLFISLAFRKINKSINYNSEIHLVIAGQGNINILSDSYIFEPSEVKINGEQNNLCKKTCNFTEETSNVTLYFNDIITTCENMFYNSTNLKEIYFYNFDFSNVISAQNMFVIAYHWKK